MKGWPLISTVIYFDPSLKLKWKKHHNWQFSSIYSFFLYYQAVPNSSTSSQSSNQFHKFHAMVTKNLFSIRLEINFDILFGFLNFADFCCLISIHLSLVKYSLSTSTALNVSIQQFNSWIIRIYMILLQRQFHQKNVMIFICTLKWIGYYFYRQNKLVKPHWFMVSFHMIFLLFETEYTSKNVKFILKI